jgi:hypothetical protein
MANTIVKMIMLIYRGRLQQFTTTEHAVQFLQRETVTTRWFRYAIIEALQQLERTPYVAACLAVCAAGTRQYAVAVRLQPTRSTAPDAQGTCGAAGEPAK